MRRDNQPIWHPCTQMKDLETCPPLEVTHASGSYLTLATGQRLIDATASWWCKSLGHGHPSLKAALTKQLDQFEHVLHSDTTNTTIFNLSKKLCDLSQCLDKVYYASDGACAVEIAIKMSLQARQIQGQSRRQKILYLENSYHGETGLAMSVTDGKLFSGVFNQCLPNNPVISGLPYLQDRRDPLWSDCEAYWAKIFPQLEEHSDQLSAVIIEPMLQGACGMKTYSLDFVRRLGKWCAEKRIHLIVDECVTAMGRLGVPFAFQMADIQPDFVCISKGLTAGFLPMSAMLTHNGIFDIFYDDYSAGKTFMHSHTFGGNALAASVALATLQVMEEENIYSKAADLENILGKAMQEIAEETGLLKNVRYLGAMVAADLKIENSRERVGYAVYQAAIKHGALMRPLGNTIYWLPPLNIDFETIQSLKEITRRSLLDAMIH